MVVVSLRGPAMNGIENGWISKRHLKKSNQVKDALDRFYFYVFIRAEQQLALRLSVITNKAKGIFFGLFLLYKINKRKSQCEG